MKKTILLVISLMVTAIFSVAAFAQTCECNTDNDCEGNEFCDSPAECSGGEGEGICVPEPEEAGTMCTVQGTIEVPDFSEDISCKLNLWYGEGSDFDCVRMNEVRVEGLGEGFGMEDALSNAGEGSGEHITPLERNILQQISSTLTTSSLNSTKHAPAMVRTLFLTPRSTSSASSCLLT